MPATTLPPTEARKILKSPPVIDTPPEPENVLLPVKVLFALRNAASEAGSPQTISRVPTPQFTAAPPLDDARTVVRCRRAGPVRTVPIPTSQFTGAGLSPAK